MNLQNSIIENILRNAKTIALVGASDKPTRDSYHIMKFLMEAGYNVIPVNPAYTEVLGKKCFPDLRQLEEPVDIVDIFRRSDEVLSIVQDAMLIGAPTVWMQMGVFNEEAASIAERAGINVIMNKCIKVEYQVLMQK
ncbi:MAG: CoA-binding protein [Ignavibacteriales bacterium]|nr:CoA-binding protein [Ignavibacteriales bacterium]